MKFYNLDTIFEFGKHKGKTLRQIIESETAPVVLGGQILNLFRDSSYIDWCIINLDHFCISKVVYNEIKKNMPKFYLSDEAIEILNQKNEDWLENKNDSRVFYGNNYDDNVTGYCSACMESPCMCSDPY